MSVTVAMAPNSVIRVSVPDTIDSGGTWSLSDDEAGTLTCDTGNTLDANNECSPDNRVRIYTHGSRISVQKITYTTSDGSYGICNIVTIVPHDHSDMYRGGPAYGVYRST